ncbi:MAG: DUF4019 domain-containing protein [Rubrivivax sp.]
MSYRFHAPQHQLLTIVARLMAAVLTFVLWPAALAQPAEADGARRAVDGWLQKLDAGRYEATWTDAAAMFQKGVPADTWQKAIREVREPLGPLQQRSETSAQATKLLPGVPDGNYLVLTYRSSFANKAFATETVAAVQETDGSWKVAGYFLK